MGKIDKYPYDLDVSDKDIILGSDIENGLKTKNFKMLNIKNYMLKDIKDIVHNGFTSKAYAIWSGSGLIFDVVYPNYYIEGVLYEGKTEQLTLYPADATNPRIDIIAVDITGAIQINGTPQASPFAPIYDEDTQLKIVNVLVNANATTPANIVEEVIYKENVEWSTSSTVPSVDFNAIDAYQGNKCIKINGFDAGQYIRFTDSVTNQTTDYDVVKFFIRLESKFIATDKILINFYNDTDKTATLVVSKSKYFFDIDKIGTYQAIIVPLTDFTFLSTTFNKFEISYLGETINSSIWFDNISLLTTDIINDNIDVSNLVPYTGATSDVDLGEFQLKTGQIEFDQTPTGAFGVGKVRWNDTDGTIEVMLKGGNVTLQVGQEQVLRVVNKTGVNLLESEYHCVYISGEQGNRLKVDLALSNNTINSNKTIGLVTENINNNLEGFVTTVGLVRGINTTGSLQGETWADGDVLYLSAVSAGSLTNIAPTTPNHKVVVGYIVRAHITQGSIFVKVDTGLAITELHDVNITATTANKVIGSTTEGIWANKTIPEILGYTPASTVSPTFTGVPSAPTATLGTNTTQLATTAFVKDSIDTNQNWSKTGDDIRNTNTAFVKIGADYSFGFNTKLSINKGTDAIGIATNGGIVAVDGFRFGDQSSGYYKNGDGQVFINYGNTGTDDWRFSPIYNLGSGTQSKSTIIIDPTLSANTGTATVNLLRLKPTINQTGSATGITRSLLIDAILTAAADYRAIEVTNGKVIFPAGVGSNEAVVMSQISNVMRNVVKDVAVSATITGVASDTEVKAYLIPSKSFSANDILTMYCEFNKVGAVGTATYKFWKNTTNSFAGATQIAMFTTVAGNLTTKMGRNFTLRSGNMMGNNASSSLVMDLSSNSNTVTTTAFDTTINNYIFVSIALAGAADTAFVSSVKINN